MTTPVHRPFEQLQFDEQICFLCGKKTQPSDKLNVFPEWLMHDYKLRDKPFKLLDESIITYNDIQVACSPDVLPEINALEDIVKKAFTAGYQDVKELSQVELFQWIAKLVYGIIYYEIRAGINNKALNVGLVDFSQSLLHKFGNLHLMLQSLIRPVVFEGVTPWTIVVFPVRNPDDAFIYRDETNTLTFSLRMKDFGIIACLQDNNATYTEHRAILEKVQGKVLHPIQFEELCGRFFYSAYLFNRLPQYTVLPTDEAIYIEAMPLTGISNKPLFDVWQNKTYAQVLENFWKEWGFTRLEIGKDPERPMSFLTDENAQFRDPEAVNSDLLKYP
ncbi:MAG TPA: hypothetical protein DIT07_00065 [Sphingobacteriaceae bacterium]|nr:hypothetical protein [Sphingobacteriaceae bacterium]